MINCLKLFVFTTLILLLFACSAATPIPSVSVSSINLKSDSSFNGSNAKVLSSLLANLNSSENGNIVSSGRPVTLHFGSLPANILGSTDCNITDNVCDITISNDINPNSGTDQSSATFLSELLEFVLLHEIGHSFGLGHVADPTAVMYWQVNESQLGNYLTQAVLNDYYNDVALIRTKGDSSGLPLFTQNVNSGVTKADEGKTLPEEEIENRESVNYHL